MCPWARRNGPARGIFCSVETALRLGSRRVSGDVLGMFSSKALISDPGE